MEDREFSAGSTEELLHFERELRREGRDLGEVRGAMWKRITSTRHVRASLELSFLLQLSMMYLASFLPQELGGSNVRYKITTVLRYTHSSGRRKSESRDLLLVKPLFFGNGRCVAIHPTMVLPDEETLEDASRADSASDRTRIGQTTVALFRGKPLFCAALPVTGRKSCPIYLPIEGPGEHPVRSPGDSTSRTAFCVPLRPDVAQIATDFKDPHVPMFFGKTCGCRPTKKEVRQRVSDETIGVVSIEAVSEQMTAQRYADFVDQPEVVQVLTLLYESLYDYRNERLRYRTLKTCGAILDISQESLHRGAAYEQLLQSISDICDGADVTLHVRDLPEEKMRSLHLIEGVGRNFRGFLVGDRQSSEHGVIGEAVTSGRSRVLPPEALGEAAELFSAVPYRQLMRSTAFNVAVPIPAPHPPAARERHERIRARGALNLEWDKETLDAARGDVDAEAYWERKKALVERAAKYVGLVLDHHDSTKRREINAYRHSSEERAKRATQEGDRRLCLGYYVGETMRRVRNAASQPPEYFGQRKFLEWIIDAAGYLLSFQNPVRFMLSLRYKRGDCLEAGPRHGEAWADASRSEIPIAPDSSVTGVSAYWGRPLFGPIRDGNRLEPDPLCRELWQEGSAEQKVPEETLFKVLSRLPPLHEVAVPVFFGEDLEAVLDFEQFTQREPDPSRREALLESLRLDRDAIEEFYDWARAVAFCTEYARDHLEKGLGLGRLDESESAAYARLRHLVALLTVNVSLPETETEQLMEDYLRTLVPARELRLRTYDQEPSDAERRVAVTYRGSAIGELEVSIGAENVAPLFETSPVSQTLDIALRFFAGVSVGAEQSRRPQAERLETFVEWMDKATQVFRAKIKAIGDDPENQRDSGALVSYVLDELNGALGAGLGVSSRDAVTRVNPNPHAWYLYQAQFVPGGSAFPEGDAFTCDSAGPTADPDALRLFINTTETLDALRQLEEGVRSWKDLARHLRKNRWVPEREPWLSLLWGSGPVRSEDLQEHLRSETGYTFRDELAAEDLRLILLHLLSERYYLDEKGVTVRTGNRQAVQSIPDIARSPMSSDRALVQRLVSKGTYSLISLPIRIADEAAGGGEAISVAVLNIMRRADRGRVFNFFKLREVAAAQELRDAVEDCLKRHLVLETLDKVLGKEPSDSEKLGPSLNGLAAEVRHSVRTSSARQQPASPAVFVIVAGVARNQYHLKPFVDVLGLEEMAPLIQTDSDVASSDLEGKCVPVLLRMKAQDSDLEELGDQVAELIEVALKGAPQCVLLFVTPETGRLLKQQHLLPPRVSPQWLYEKEDLDANWSYFKGTVGRYLDTKTLLVSRRSGTWGSEEMKRLLAGRASTIYARAQAFARELESARGFRINRSTFSFSEGFKRQWEESE